ncbi:zinc finger, CCHC-type containing protein [Tanacetum coccineum]
MAERKNMTSKEMVNSMLSYSGLSEGFWGEAIAVVRLTEPKIKNLSEKGIDCIFFGYAEHSKCYMFYVIEPNDYVSVNSIIESGDAIFDEEQFTSIPRPRGMIQPSSSKIAEDEVEGTDDVPGPSVSKKSTRTRKAKSFGSDFQLYLVEGTRDKTLSQRKYCFVIEEDLSTLSEAMASRDVAFWKEAVQSEIDSIMHNDTWELTDLPPGCKALGCKWILKRKMKVVGSIDKYKPRLVIQGFRQKKGIDFFDTYAPVARISTIRLLLALAAIHDPVIHQMDVKTAFINDQVNKTKEFLSSNFDMKDLGEAEVILGIRIKRGNNALGRVFQYLKGTMDYGLTYSGYPSVIEGYSDASWINNMEDHSSTSGWVFLLGGGAIFWASNKRTCITSLTMKSEFVALAAAGNEAEWLRNLVYEIPLWPKPMSTISIRCDSAATLAKAYSQVYNGKSRHLGVRHNMIREFIMNGVIYVEFVRTQLNLADHLTKGLARDLVRKAEIEIGLKST